MSHESINKLWSDKKMITNESLESLHLLCHPFYQAWSAGSLPIEVLQKYAAEYYHHVAAFPRYISQIHAWCDDIKSRQILLGNLMDEELGDNNHPALWLRFADAIGAVMNIEPELLATKQLVDGYFELVRKNYATGLGAIYAYERQTPEVSKSKIEGLKKHYAITEEKALEFFIVHEAADQWHCAELEGLIHKLKPEEKKDFETGAVTGAKLLWGFLDGMSCQ